MSTENSSKRLISIVRRPTELIALVSTCQEVAPSAAGAGDSFTPARFETKEVPLANVPHALCPELNLLWESWRYLARAPALDDRTLFHVLILVLRTVPGVTTPADPLPPLAAALPVRTFHRTAAHPRGYRGTKYQPPKPKEFPVTDLRPYLCRPDALRGLLDQTAKYLRVALRGLHQAGFARNQMAELEAELRRRDRLWKLPADFSLHIWPQLRELSVAEFSAYLRIFQQLELSKNLPLLSTISRLLSLQTASEVLPWCQIGERLGPERRLAYFSVLAKTTGDRQSLPMLQPDHVLALDQVAPAERFEKWLERLVARAELGIPVDYLLAGIRLAAKFHVIDDDFRVDHGCAEFSEAIAEELALRWRDVAKPGFLAIQIWRCCGELPGMADVLRRDWTQLLDAQSAYKYLSSIQQLAYLDLPERKRSEKWQAVKAQLPKLETLLESVPVDYRSKAIDYFFDCVWWWDEPKQIKTLVPMLFRVISMLARPPFRRDHRTASATAFFFQMPAADDLEKFLGAPERSWHAFEKACARENNARLVYRGLESLVKYHGRLTVDGFIKFPATLMKVAKSLGTLRSPLADQLSQEVKNHALISFNPAALPLAERCRFISAQCKDHYFDPAPAKLKAWAAGEIELSAARLSRYERIQTVNLVRTRLTVFEQAVSERLSRDFSMPSITKNTQHALQLLSSMEYNRRGLRRFLQAYLSGNRDYLANHVETRRWYRSHPRIDRKLWETGVHYATDQITIEVENDPLEILKMGTYVGSCLGLGGWLADCAVAALLDANKKVLFEKDRLGNIVARQLVAISRGDQLVCFEVYPKSAKPAIKNLLKQYDAALAAALGVDLYDAKSQQSYEIEHVISHTWYDDGAWDSEEDN